MWLPLSLPASPAMALAACGGGGDGGSGGPTATVITAIADTFTLDAGQTGNLLANDRIGSAAANGAGTGNAVFSLTSGALPTGVTVDSAGGVSVSAAAVPATLNLAYRLCEAVSASNGATASAAVTILVPPIVATNDSFTLAACGSGDALANDTLRGTPATAAQVTASATSALPTGVTQTAAGLLSVANTASDSSVMPGDFTTVVIGNPAAIESFGALNVRLADSAGAALNLRSGQSATVRIPLASRDTNPPATIPLFFFDTSSGRWVQEDTATLNGTGAARYYQGTVTHFSTWNADQISNTVRVTGCVADANGVRVSGATVSSDGINYSGTSTAYSDVNGNFTIGIRRSSQATLAARSGTLRSNTLSVGPYTADAQLSGCLTLGQASGGITMKLTWGANPSDLDSHLVAPSGTEVYYFDEGSLSAAPYAALDVDDTSSFGSEVITTSRLMVGTYRYFVVNFSGHSDGPIAASSARVELNIPGRAAELFTPQAAGETASTALWSLFELDVDAQCNVTVRRLGSYANSEPVTPPISNPVYCVR